MLLPPDAPVDKCLRVYVAGPLSQGDPAMNVAYAVEVGTALRELGFVPFIPHLSHFWSMIAAAGGGTYRSGGHFTYDDWLNYDLAWLKTCQAMYRIAGLSKGADIEEAFAKANGIPVFSNITDLDDFAAEHGFYRLQWWGKE
jgi:hypothetical protein